MIDLGTLAGSTVAVLGLGRSGLATARALAAAGVQPVVWDDAAPARALAEREGLVVADPARNGFGGAAMLVLSPGIRRGHPQPHPVVARALAEGLAIVSDIDLLARAQPAAGYLGITGTNGKSTTTALIGHILASAGVPVAVGGNLGTPALALDPIGAGGWYVIELSSYQLETVSRPQWRIGVLLNITPDHLDRYATMDDYVAAKLNLFRAPPAGAVAVIGVDDSRSRAIWRDLAEGGGQSRVLAISAQGRVPGGVSAAGGVLIDDLDGGAGLILDLRDLPHLPGAHNWQNAAAAYAAARAAGLPPRAIVAGITSFPGLRHRQELVAEIDGIRFVNDSKATNADAAAKALACYQPIYWIAGGRPKTDGIDPLAGRLGPVAQAFLIGEAAPRFRATIGDALPVTMSGMLDRAVEDAFAAARRDGRAGAVVLLSPACASFDQFDNFEARGDAFVAAVRRLQAESPRRAAESSRVAAGGGA